MMKTKGSSRAAQQRDGALHRQAAQGNSLATAVKCGQGQQQLQLQATLGCLPADALQRSRNRSRHLCAFQRWAVQNAVGPPMAVVSAERRWQQQKLLLLLQLQLLPVRQQ